MQKEIQVLEGAGEQGVETNGKNNLKLNVGYKLDDFQKFVWLSLGWTGLPGTLISAPASTSSFSL